jgi:hypothetical protein
MLLFITMPKIATDSANPLVLRLDFLGFTLDFSGGTAEKWPVLWDMATSQTSVPSLRT